MAYGRVRWQGTSICSPTGWPLMAFLESIAEFRFASSAISIDGLITKASVHTKSTKLSSSDTGATSSGEGGCVGMTSVHWYGYSTFYARKALRPGARIEAVPTPREALLEEYRCYLRDERGLSEATARNVLPFVDRFLVRRSPRHNFDFPALNAKDVTEFVRKEAAELGSVQAKHMVTALRGFFRYLRHRGDIETDLAGCVPCVPYYSFSTVPKFLPPGTVEKILGAIDRRSPTGRRDRAMLMLLARLGLRTCELVRLELEDIDWELGEITIRGKGGRWSKLPLPPDVGESLAVYLRHDRPRCLARQVFITQRAPIHEYASVARSSPHSANWQS
jgi:site-specific recombinase XerD